MRIRKKAWREGFEKILSGEKTFDARLANFDCKEGDFLVLEEYDPVKKKYTGRKMEKKITFVLNTNKQQAEETATCPITGKVVENDLVSRCNISGCEHFNIHKSLLQNKEYSHLL